MQLGEQARHKERGSSEPKSSHIWRPYLDEQPGKGDTHGY